MNTPCCRKKIGSEKMLWTSKSGSSTSNCIYLVQAWTLNTYVHHSPHFLTVDWRLQDTLILSWQTKTLTRPKCSILVMQTFAICDTRHAEISTNIEIPTHWHVFELFRKGGRDVKGQENLGGQQQEYKDSTCSRCSNHLFFFLVIDQLIAISIALAVSWCCKFSKFVLGAVKRFPSAQR